MPGFRGKNPSLKSIARKLWCTEEKHVQKRLVRDSVKQEYVFLFAHDLQMGVRLPRETPFGNPPLPDKSLFTPFTVFFRKCFIVSVASHIHDMYLQRAIASGMR